MLYGTQLGFNPFATVASGIRSVAKGAYSVASDPNVQRAAVAATQAYAPNQYAQAVMYADRARGILRPPPPPGAMPMPPPQMPPPGPDGDDDVSTKMAPVQKGNLMPLAIGGAALLVLILLLKK